MAVVKTFFNVNNGILILHNLFLLSSSFDTIFLTFFLTSHLFAVRSVLHFSGVDKLIEKSKKTPKNTQYNCIMSNDVGDTNSV